MNNLKFSTARLCQIGREFIQYIQRTRFAILLLALFTYLIHGSKLHSMHLGIDTEQVLVFPDTLYEGWHSIGRYGLTFIKKLTGQMDFNPFFASALTLLSLVLAAVAFCFLFVQAMPAKVISGKDSDETPAPYTRKERIIESVSLFLFGATVIASPIITEQMYFSLQSAEVAFSFFLCAVSLLFAHEWSKKPGVLYFICSVIFLPLIFSVYQSFVPLYIFGVVALCCLHLSFSEEALRFADAAKYVGLHIVIFLCGFFLNQWITTRFFAQSSYLTNQILWDFADPGTGFRRILSHIRSAVLGQGTFYTAAFGGAILLLLLLWLIRIFRAKSTAGSIGNLFLLGALFLSPFFLTIVLGERPVARAELVLPFTTAFLLYLSFLLLYQQMKFAKPAVRNFLKTVFCLLAIFCLWDGADTSARMYYTDTIRFQQDLALAQELRQYITQLTGDAYYEGYVIFIGERPFEYRGPHVTGDIMGQSFFAWDTEAEPANHWSSHRIVNFMNCLGCNYAVPTKDHTIQATALAADMPCYPAKGSMVLGENQVIIKLSE